MVFGNQIIPLVYLVSDAQQMHVYQKIKITPICYCLQRQACFLTNPLCWNENVCFNCCCPAPVSLLLPFRAVTFLAQLKLQDLSVFFIFFSPCRPCCNILFIIGIHLNGLRVVIPAIPQHSNHCSTYPFHLLTAFVRTLSCCQYSSVSQQILIFYI